MIKKVFAILVVLLALSYAKAAVVFYDGFETQPIGSFASSGSATVPVGDSWYNDWPKSPDSGELVVTNEIAQTGVNSLKITRNWPAGGQYPTLFGFGPNGSAVAGNQLKYIWNFYLPSNESGPQVYIGLGAPASGGWLVENGGVGVAAIGHLAVQNNGAWVDTGVAVTPQTWVTFEMDIQILASGTTQRKGTFDAFITVNGVKTQVASSYALTRQTFTDDYANFHIYGNPTVSTFYMDNISIEAIPEPATISLLGIGLAALLRKKS